MPKKKSVRKAAERFVTEVVETKEFADNVSTGQTDKHITFIHDYSIIKLYKNFEQLILDTLIGAINNDTTTLSQKTGFDFPKHLTDEVCEYLITGNSYFDFRGRSGLISKLKEYVPNDHYLVNIVKKSKYTDALDQLYSLRNFAAHESKKSKDAVLNVLNKRRIKSSGAWLKIEVSGQKRIDRLFEKLTELGNEIKNSAPY